MRFDHRLLGWGAFFILLGSIPLAVRQGWLDAAVVDRWWALWPLLLIGGGLGLILRETRGQWIGGAITAITWGVMGGGLIATGLGNIPFAGACDAEGGVPFVAPKGTLAGPTTVSISMPCGELTIEAVDGDEWSLSGTSGPNAVPVVKTGGGGVQIGAPEGFNFDNRGRQVWNLSLPREPQGIQLDVTLNAGEGRANLDGLSLNGVQVTLNAGDLTVDVSNTVSLAGVSGTVNAGALSFSLPAVGTGEFTVNAGSLNICVPEGAAVRVETSGALGSNNLDDLGLSEVEEDTWETAGYGSATSRVQLDVTTNAGSFDLAIGGDCGA